MSKILVVDDSLFMRKMLKDILLKVGHEIIGEAKDANEAVHLYKELHPDVVTMDIIMPVVEDMTALKAVQSIIRMDKNAKIIMVSAMGQKEMIVELIQAGAKDFIIKPFEEDDIYKALEKVI